MIRGNGLGPEAVVFTHPDVDHILGNQANSDAKRLETGATCSCPVFDFTPF